MLDYFNNKLQRKDKLTHRHFGNGPQMLNGTVSVHLNVQVQQPSFP